MPNPFSRVTSVPSKAPDAAIMTEAAPLSYRISATVAHMLDWCAQTQTNARFFTRGLVVDTLSDIAGQIRAFFPERIDLSPILDDLVDAVSRHAKTTGSAYQEIRLNHIQDGRLPKDGGPYVLAKWYTASPTNDGSTSFSGLSQTLKPGWSGGAASSEDLLKHLNIGRQKGFLLTVGASTAENMRAQQAEHGWHPALASNEIGGMSAPSAPLAEPLATVHAIARGAAQAPTRVQAGQSAPPAAPSVKVPSKAAPETTVHSTPAAKPVLQRASITPLAPAQHTYVTTALAAGAPVSRTVPATASAVARPQTKAGDAPAPILHPESRATTHMPAMAGRAAVSGAAPSAAPSAKVPSKVAPETAAHNTPAAKPVLQRASITPLAPAQHTYVPAVPAALAAGAPVSRTVPATASVVARPQTKAGTAPAPVESPASASPTPDASLSKVAATLASRVQQAIDHLPQLSPLAPLLLASLPALSATAATRTVQAAAHVHAATLTQAAMRDIPAPLRQTLENLSLRLVAMAAVQLTPAAPNVPAKAESIVPPHIPADQLARPATAQPSDSTAATPTPVPSTRPVTPVRAAELTDPVAVPPVVRPPLPARIAPDGDTPSRHVQPSAADLRPSDSRPIMVARADVPPPASPAITNKPADPPTQKAAPKQTGCAGCFNKNCGACAAMGDKVSAILKGAVDGKIARQFDVRPAGMRLT